MNFMRFMWLYFLISAIVILPGIYSLVRFGLRPSIDFTGGALLEIKTSKAATENINKVVKKIEGVSLESVQKTGQDSYLLKLKPIDQAKKNVILADLEKEFGKVEELRFETVGPILGQELIVKTLVAMVLATAFILFYIAYQFHGKNYGLCASAATLHDSLVILGTFSLLGHFKGVEIDTLFVTAVLTSISFSVHDTVVVYDRIRESIKRFPRVSYVDLLNKAVTETMNRSLNNSLTIIFMLAVLWLVGGETIKWFVFALLIGTITGAYSSPFVATPLLLVWKNIADRRKK
jgi:preprotein translocase subunit SecF